MICLDCKTSNPETARFCSNCGSDLGEITQVVAVRTQADTLMKPAKDSLLNSTLAGRYRLTKKIGAGGMGTVYLATRLNIGDEVAVKILHSEQSDPHAAERFRREAQAAARLKHPNAVTIHDFGVTDDGMQYLVMELVDGQSVRRIIKQQGPFTPSAAAEILSQVCAALDEAHRHHIIHRDIKPDNIVVNVTDNGLRVKVLDFGIAKLRDDTASNLTQTGSILGTPHYMSPEQCLGEELDGRSDIYSVGVVLYEMLTGLVPFNSPTSAAVVVQQVTQPPPSLRSLNPSVPAAVESVVLHALEKQRDARPQTAAKLALEFSTALNQRHAGLKISDFDTANQNASSHLGSGSVPTMVLSDRTFGQSSINSALRPSSISQPVRGQSRSHLILLSVIAVFAVLGIVGVGIWAMLRNGGAAHETAQRVETAATRDTTDQAASPVRIAATASSVSAPAVGASYEARNALDGKMGTAWIEGVDGPGIGQWIRFDFDREVELHGVIISPGYFKSAALWTRNNRVAAASLNFSNGTVQRVQFPDRMEKQTVPLASIKTNSVKIVIEEVYFGQDPDTAISEVSFDFGERDSAAAPAQAAAIAPTPVVRLEDAPPVNVPMLRQEVVDVLNGWAGAARDHDLDAQMSFYADTVDPYFLKRNVSAAYVRTSRALAFSRYSKLDVQLSNINIQLDQAGTHASATFDKAYAFEGGEKNLSGSVNSMVWLTKSGTRWLITGERDLKVYYTNK